MEISLTRIVGSKGSSIFKKIAFWTITVLIGFIAYAIFNTIDTLSDYFYTSTTHRGRVEDRWPFWVIVIPFIFLFFRLIYVKYTSNAAKLEYLKQKHVEMLNKRAGIGVTDPGLADNYQDSLNLELDSPAFNEHTSMPIDVAEDYRKKIAEQEKQMKDLNRAMQMLLKQNIQYKNRTQISFTPKEENDTDFLNRFLS